MRLSIQHETCYRYDTPVQYSIQQLRLTPANTPVQFVIKWELEAPNKMEIAHDAYGNTVHTLVLHRPRGEIRLKVQGEVDTVDLSDGRLQEGIGRIPLPHFTCPTRLTEPDQALVDLAMGVGPLSNPGNLLHLASAISERVVYTTGSTDVGSTAVQALALGEGVCQDHAHLMLACCRVRGLPARYVSGYLDPGNVPHAASHAWVDVWMEGMGWISLDVTNACFASGKYCRVAVGRDYEASAPVRGTRIGGGHERMEVFVQVNAQTQFQQ
jgi:transglutaminase-like putative cysteine protease